MIQTQLLSRNFGKHSALTGITLHVPESSVVALVGPNGAGKSTLLKILLNVITPTSGTAEVLGVDSRRLGARQLAQLGYVSEGQVRPEWMRLDSYLRYTSALYPQWDPLLAQQLIREFGLPLERKLAHLSRGMKVKAALTAALAYRPRLLLLDEPFSGLDVLTREQLIESLIDHTSPAAILLASHDLSDIETFATHVAYLNEGRLVFAEEMTALAARFREVEVTTSEGAATSEETWPSTWRRVETSGSVVRFVDTSYDNNSSRQAVAERFKAVRQVHIRQLSLREIFLALARERRTACS